jgi:hypothetical protein
MPQEQPTAANWITSNVRDVVGASAQEVKEASKASLDASRAVMEIYREAAAILRDRGDSAFRTGMAVMEAGFDANFDQLNRLAETKNLQDVIRLDMLWGANLTLALCRALTKANGSGVAGEAKRPEAANA